MDELSDRPPQNSSEFASQQPAVISTSTELHQTPTHPVPSTAINQPLPVQAPQSRAEREPSSIFECRISDGARLFSLVDIPVIFGFILIQARFLKNSIDNANGVNNTSGTYVPLPRGSETSQIITGEVFAICVRQISCLFLLCGVLKNHGCLCILWIVCVLGHIFAEFRFNLYESYYSQRNVLWTLSFVTIYNGFGIGVVAAFMLWLNTEEAPRDAADRARAIPRNPMNGLMMMTLFTNSNV